MQFNGINIAYIGIGNIVQKLINIRRYNIKMDTTYTISYDVLIEHQITINKIKRRTYIWIKKIHILYTDSCSTIIYFK